MRKYFLVSICIVLVLFSSCGPEPNRYIPENFTDKEEYFDNESFHDRTDFCKYHYTAEADAQFAELTGYQRLLAKDKGKLIGYFDQFAGALESRQDVIGKYDFNPKTYITPVDYYHIDTYERLPISDDEYGKYDDYTIYYYDTETHTLYYIHTSI